jgi:hypothetical protein
VNNGYSGLWTWIIAQGITHQAIPVIKLIHTAIFLVMTSSVLYVTYSGIRNRVNQWTMVSLLVIAGEGIVLTLNQGRCPLTVLVEDLGGERGSVSDIFLPTWVARHIPHIMALLLSLGGAALTVQGGARQRRRAFLFMAAAALYLVPFIPTRLFSAARPPVAERF